MPDDCQRVAALPAERLWCHYSRLLIKECDDLG